MVQYAEGHCQYATYINMKKKTCNSKFTFFAMIIKLLTIILFIINVLVKEIILPVLDGRQIQDSSRLKVYQNGTLIFDRGTFYPKIYIMMAIMQTYSRRIADVIAIRAIFLLAILAITVYANKSNIMILRKFSLSSISKASLFSSSET